MTIELITGLPGNSKTLYTISQVKALSERENRPVYYSGIAELTLGWTEIDPKKWMDCPPGSIIVIDECQAIFRNRSLGAAPPVFVTDLETHRHLGIDLFFITQHPSLVDPHIRRLSGRHRHMVRVWGMEVSTVHSWDSVKDNCDKTAARKDSEKTKWAFDKSLYNCYKSAQLHTIKRAIPFRAKMLMAVPFLIIALGYLFYTTAFKNKGRVENSGVTSIPVGISAQGAGRGGGVAAAGVDKVFDPVADARQYVAMATPRIVGLPQTAPKYDELTKPIRVPVPAACIQVVERCKCLTQQGTPMDVEHSMCVGFARNGFFQEFDADGDRQAGAKTERATAVMEGHDSVPRSVAPASPGQSQVSSFGNPPPDPPRKPAVGA